MKISAMILVLSFSVVARAEGGGGNTASSNLPPPSNLRVQPISQNPPDYCNFHPEDVVCGKPVQEPAQVTQHDAIQKYCDVNPEDANCEKIKENSASGVR